MKNLIQSMVAIALVAGTASAATYTDTDDDIFDLGSQHLDIISVTITNDASNLHVMIETDGDLDASNGGKYALGINNGVGASDNSNAWGRNIDWGQGITHWIATWADNGGSGIGGQVWEWDGSSWTGPGGLSGSDDSQHAAGFQIFSISLGDLGVGVGDTIDFDVITTGGGGGGPGIDHLSNAGLATTGWGVQSRAGSFLSYTIVPAPGVMMLLGIGGVLVAGRRF